MHGMVLIDSVDVPVLEVIANLLGGLELEVGRRARMEEGTCLIILPLTFLAPAAEIHANLLGQVGGEDVRDPNPGVAKPKHSHVHILVLWGIICYCTTLLLLALGLGRLGFTFGGGRVMLVPCVSTGCSIITSSA